MTIGTPVSTSPGLANSLTLSMTYTAPGLGVIYVFSADAPTGCSDPQNGTYAQVEQVVTSGRWITAYAANVAAGTPTVTVSCATANLIALQGVPVTAATLDVHGSLDSNFAGTASVDNAISSASVTTTGVDQVLALFVNLSIVNGTGALTGNGGYTTLMTTLSTIGGTLPWCLEYLTQGSAGAIAPPATVNGQCDVAAITLAFKPSAAVVFDGSKPAPVTTVATGTSGTAMGAVTTSNWIDVLVIRENSSTGTCTVADSLGNVYTQIDHRDYTAAGFELYRFLAPVTVAGTPVITATVGGFPLAANISAAILTGLSATPFTVGNVAAANQFPVTVATDAQAAAALPTLGVPNSVIGVWSLVGSALASSSGTGYTQQGTSCAALSGLRVTYETKAVAGTSPVTATFNPASTNRAITLSAAFNTSAAVAYTAQLGTGSFNINGQATTAVISGGLNYFHALIPGRFVINISPGIVDLQSDLGTGYFTITGGNLNTTDPFQAYPTIDFDIYDNGNGSVTLRWGPFTATAPATPDSYNVYVNGVLNQNVPGLTATVTGLTIESYNASTQTVTASVPYTFKVVAVYAGREAGASYPDKTVNPGPQVVPFVTPMKRLFPFPNTRA